MSPPLLACLAAAAAFYHLPPRALVAIQAVEGGRVGLASRNQDGSEDFGLMQVNSRWLAPLSAATGLPATELRRRLLDDGCFNITVGAAILRVETNAAKGDLGAALGHYHSRTPARATAYRARVLQAAQRLCSSTTTVRQPAPPG
jgi:soluble lytic murein transglycosylase-like protein